MNKEMIYLKGQCKARGHFDTLKAITAANKLHRGQKRKSGEDYIVHPLRVASSLLALKITDEEVISTAILHDVIEDCNITKEELVYKYGIKKEVAEYVSILTKTKDMSTEEYYNNIKQHPVCVLVKIADRCNNVSTMAGVFSNKKIALYVEETEKYIIPLCKYGKELYPNLGDEIFTMKYHILSILEFAKLIAAN